ncbi:SGNH/GDSL hydrolase family protein [Stieleria sp. JC731]|uniref:SGNH/GDSL hydrolase family protein n=1 Tax=Pirellulaceae TaxID=2691357 RepID=UPI001E283814|nr:SGNH/GDSL hydrolase family protein [Stieleria sp. JC731]MCC9602160.1 SGNH/GDSL hydrolase family protein [Stieleria sp. JC731]
MRQTRRSLVAFVLSAIATFTLAASQLRAQSDSTINVGKAELSTGDTIVFLGDSITHQRLYTQYIEDFFITRYPNIELNFHNAGIGGDRAWDALQRLDRDVLQQSPELVTILLGMNDGRYQPFNQEVYDTYKQDMTTLLDRLEAAKTTVSPITPTMFDAEAARNRLKQRPRDPSMIAQYNAVLAYFGTWLRDEADQRGMQSIDMFSPLNQLTREARKEDITFTFISDSVHPGPAGQLIMAHAWLENLGQQGSVSTIVLTPSPKGYRGRGRGGEITELSSDDDSIEFTFLANSLPWVTPEATNKAAQMLRLDHRFSKESFQVHGLAPGKYALAIDGTAIGEFSNTQLASHVELQRFPNTPQSLQATKVMEMNAKRNETTIRRLRDHWVAYRNLQRDKHALEEATDDAAKENYQKRITAGEERMKTFEEELVAIEKQASEELHAIYEAAQPVAHRYVLKRVD